MEIAVVPVCGLFETHLTVADLQRSMTFFGKIPGLQLAEVFEDRKVAFYWNHSNLHAGSFRSKSFRQTHRVRIRRARSPCIAQEPGKVL